MKVSFSFQQQFFCFLPCANISPYSVQMRENTDQNISPYSVRMRENKDQNNSKYGHFLRNVELILDGY